MKGGLDWFTYPDELDLSTDQLGGTRTHVIPFNDDRAHARSVSCWCKPEQGMQQFIWIHNSADGREVYERGDRKLN